MSLFLLSYRNNEKPQSPGPERTSTMVSRRRILSRSRDDLNLPEAPAVEEEDVWFSKEKLLKVSTSLNIREIQLLLTCCIQVHTHYAFILNAYTLCDHRL